MMNSSRNSSDDGRAMAAYDGWPTSMSHATT